MPARWPIRLKAGDARRAYRGAGLLALRHWTKTIAARKRKTLAVSTTCKVSAIRSACAAVITRAKPNLIRISILATVRCLAWLYCLRPGPAGYLESLRERSCSLATRSNVSAGDLIR